MSDVAKASPEPAGAKADVKGETKEPEMPEIKPTQFIVPAALIGIKYFKLDLTQYLMELRVAFAVVSRPGHWSW